MRCCGEWKKILGRTNGVVSSVTSFVRSNNNIYRSATNVAKQSPYVSGTTTHFGYEEVDVKSKQDKVRHVFESVAESYDVMNDALSGGLHRYWKDSLLQFSQVEYLTKQVRQRNQLSSQAAKNTSGASRDIATEFMSNRRNEKFQILDVAGGTGDVAFRFVEHSGVLERAKSSGIDESVGITVCDINTEMLRVGRQRAMQAYGHRLLEHSQALSFIEGNAQDLSNFTSNSYDLYTIAFGLRNVTDVDKALREARRVLKPGGRFLCLEFSHVPNPVLQSIYDAYSFNVIPVLGQMIADDRDSYQYLVESIRKFPKQEDLSARMQQAGLQSCSYQNLSGGIVAIHEGFAPLE